MAEDLTTVATGAEDAAGTDAELDVSVSPPDDEVDDAIPVSEVLGKPSEKKGDNEGGDAATGKGKPDAKETTKADKPEDKKKPEPPKPDQAAIDRAIGERLNRERQKWEQQHKADIALAKALRRIHAGSKDDEIIQEATERKAETLGWTPEQMRYAIGNPATEIAPAAAAPEGAEQPDETRALVNRIIEETPELKEEFPDFDPAAFIRDMPMAVEDMRTRGLSLVQAYKLHNMDAIIERAKREAQAEGERVAAERIRNRNARVPDTTKGASSGATALDITNMSDEEFDRIEQMVKSGRRVRLD